MISLTDSARQRMEQYVAEVHRYLAGCSGVDAQEVERELASAPSPVSEADLNGVLGRLGSASQWVPPGEQPWWRRGLSAMRLAPEHQRLAYISLAGFLLGIIIPHLFLVTIIGSFILSRASISGEQSPNKLRRKQWFVYPALIVVYVPLLAMLLLWPTGAIGSVIPDYDMNFDELLRHPHRMLAWISVPTATAVWWIVLGILLMNFTSAFNAVFKPFANSRRFGSSLIWTGTATIILSVMVFFAFRWFAGHPALFSWWSA
jgi:hypothetical protein